jgi:hypothetical protein
VITECGDKIRGSLGAWKEIERDDLELLILKRSK